MAKHTATKKKAVASADPLEVELVFQVRDCTTCTFFFPKDRSRLPYGPYPAYDFNSNTPKTASPKGNPISFPWVKGTTSPPAFPDPEVMDGCRKAPIMTIGINPNLTAFAPGETGTSWCYPNFTNKNGTDPFTKYAYYYRYRSVYQEHFDLKFVEKYLLSEGRIAAEKPGVIVSANRTSEDPSYPLVVRYDGDSQDTTIELHSELDQPRYVLLLNPMPPNNRFKKGALIAAKLDVPAGHKAEVFAQQIGYYEQFVPVLGSFEDFLKKKGHAKANLHIGEDVCQLDMVACASPHWGPQWLGGSMASENTIIDNCVTKNAWAMKQLAQTKPAVLFLVGEASYNMFLKAFGKLIKSNPVLPKQPEDGAFTLLRATTDPHTPCVFEFSTTIDRVAYKLSTRLVITPHFSYNSNFLPQFRLSSHDWEEFQKNFADCANFLQHDPRVTVVPAPSAGGFAAIEITKDPQKVLQEIQKKYANAWQALSKSYYDAHQMMASVLEDLYNKKQITFTNAKGKHPGFLTRTDGPCSFCVNQHWEFPLGCPYDKPEEKQLPAGFLEKVTQAIVKKGGVTVDQSKLHEIRPMPGPLTGKV
jgi:hypothetical protein